MTSDKRHGLAIELVEGNPESDGLDRALDLIDDLLLRHGRSGGTDPGPTDIIAIFLPKSRRAVKHLPRDLRDFADNLVTLSIDDMEPVFELIDILAEDRAVELDGPADGAEDFDRSTEERVFDSMAKGRSATVAGSLGKLYILPLAA